jgi:hypothetical protein
LASVLVGALVLAVHHHGAVKPVVVAEPFNVRVAAVLLETVHLLTLVTGVVIRQVVGQL